MKKLNVTKGAAIMGLVKLPALPAGQQSGEKVGSAKERVRRLSLSSGAVEKLDNAAKRAVRSSLVSSHNTARSSKSSQATSMVQIDPEQGFSGGLGTGSSGDLSAQEPPITCKADVQVWTAWAKQEAQVEVNLKHPRLRVVEGALRMKTRPRKRPDGDGGDGAAAQEEESRRLGMIKALQLPLLCSSDELMEVFGVGVRLYFDLMKLFIGIAILGILCMIPSYYASLANSGLGAYASSKLVLPGSTALMSLGARALERDTAYGAIDGCNTASCNRLNTWTAGLDVLFVLIAWGLVREFRKYAIRLATIDGEVNVRVEDYTVELFGFEGLKSTEPAEVKTHVEGALNAHAKAKVALYTKFKEYHDAKLADKATCRRVYHGARSNLNAALIKKWQLFLDENCAEVADVTMIVKDRGLLRRLVKLVPLEKNLSTLQKRLEIAEATDAGGCTKWSLKSKAKAAERRLDYKRRQVDDLATKDLRPMGAFVTFERARAQHVALELWKPAAKYGIGGWLFGCCCDPQPAYARFNEKASGGDEESNQRLTASHAPRPQNVRYENLAVKFAASTQMRRCCSTVVLICILICSLAIAIASVAVKTSSKNFATILFKETGVLANIANLTGSNLTTTVQSGLECTAGQQALISNATAALSSDLIGEVNRLIAEVSGTSTSTDGLRLLVALLSCQMVPLLNTLVTVIIVVLNVCVTSSVHSLVEFCRYDSLTAQNSATVIRIAFVQFLNTGVCTYLVNMATGPSAIPGVPSPIPDYCWHPTWSNYYLPQPDDAQRVPLDCFFGERGIFLKGSHFDLGPKWYTDVGASFVLTLFITFVLRNAPILVSAFMHKFKKATMANGVRHVEVMKALFLGPVPQLAFLLGKMIAFAGLCMVFSTLLPLLHIVLFLYLLVSYWVDKWYLLRICRTPTPYDASFIHSTLWWVQWALLIKLILAFWAFGSMPGITLSWVLSAAGSALAGATGTTVSIVATTTAFLDAQGDSWIYNRMRTIGSVFLIVGIAVLCVMMLVAFLGEVAWVSAVSTFHNLRFGDDDEERLWPAEYPKFADVVRGKGVSSRVRIYKKANPSAGQREVLALQSDVDGRCCASCMSPMEALMFCFGIETSRKKFKTLDEFKALEERNNAIIGSENMSYAPHFMPNYADAFAFDPTISSIIEGDAGAAKPVEPSLSLEDDMALTSAA